MNRHCEDRCPPAITAPSVCRGTETEYLCAVGCVLNSSAKLLHSRPSHLLEAVRTSPHGTRQRKGDYCASLEQSPS